MTAFGEMQDIFWEMSKKGHSKISSKIWPPVSEVLDPLLVCVESMLVFFFIKTLVYYQKQPSSNRDSLTGRPQIKTIFEKTKK